MPKKALSFEFININYAGMRPSVNTWHNHIIYTFFKETVHKHGGTGVNTGFLK